MPTAQNVDSSRALLEQQLVAERRAGKTAEDPTIQKLEDQIIQTRFDEEVSKQVRGTAKGIKQYLKLPVFYATNRQIIDSSYSSELSDNNQISLGTADVTIGIGHGVRIDHLPGATFVPKAQGTASVAQVVSFSTSAKFRSALVAKAAHRSPKILIFVHGFNTSFEEALKRTALLAAELRSPIIPIAFSWPSADSVWGYSHDEDVVRASTEAFAAFLKQILPNAPADVVIVCHSMGAREVTGALSDISKEAFDIGRLSRVVYVAADIYTQEFESRWPTLSSLTNVQYAFYASKSDFALWASMLKHDAPRLGYADSKLWPPPGATTVDASNVDSILNTIGHSYIENPQLGADIGNWITTGNSPTLRGLLRHSTPNGFIYYFP